jgi:hypothetical protein
MGLLQDLYRSGHVAGHTRDAILETTQLPETDSHPLPISIQDEVDESLDARGL